MSVVMFYRLDVNFLAIYEWIIRIMFIFLDKIRRTLGEGTFGKVVEVKDSREYVTGFFFIEENILNLFYVVKKEGLH